ncbi:hypothetical protein M3Y94_00719400 [Aphelenchoides besseyi]|nr:hypothetical protein M3Y94_00719400 [Aphelenchoides besseyi]KAI6231790.1 N-acetyltransferase domain-containing protein [Aphelenchoides besseyi]
MLRPLRWSARRLAAAVPTRSKNPPGRSVAARLRPLNLPKVHLLQPQGRRRMTAELTVGLDYEIVKTTDKDADEVLDFMLEDFLHSEPLNAAVDLKADEARPFFREIVDAGLSCPLNYVVRNKDGKIVALRWATVVHRNDAENDYVFESNAESSKVREIQRLLSSVESRIWQLVPPDVNNLFSWLIVSVHESFTRRGLGKKLLEYKPDEIRALGCDGFVTAASAFNSQQLFAKLGYEEIYALKLADWKDDKNEQIFRCLDRTDKISLLLKRL